MFASSSLVTAMTDFADADIGFVEDIGIERVTMQDDGARQALGHEFGAVLVELDELGDDAGLFGLDILRQEQADIAAAQDDDAAMRGLLMAEAAIAHGSHAWCRRRNRPRRPPACCRRPSE